jgi:two-component system, sporulation sensor kinase E
MEETGPSEKRPPSAECKDDSVADKIDSQARLAAAVAHKVNNPLTYVMNYLFVLKQTVKDGESLRMISKVEEGINEAAGILNGLVDVSGASREQILEIDLGSLVPEIIASVTNDNEAVINNMVDTRSRVRAAKTGLRMAIRNVIENSLETGAGNVHISTTEDRETVTLNIRDDGHGIEEEHLTMLYEPYFTTRPEKSGLGLYAAFNAVRSFGGSLRCAGTKGMGAEFGITLRKTAP